MDKWEVKVEMEVNGQKEAKVETEVKIEAWQVQETQVLRTLEKRLVPRTWEVSEGVCWYLQTD
jgi:hypothetical protein